SFAMYNTVAEIDVLADALKKIVGHAGARARAAVPAVVASDEEPAYPAASASSPEEAAGEVVEIFELLEDWHDRYQYLIERGENRARSSSDWNQEESRVRGAQAPFSRPARRKPGTGDVLDFLAWSDAQIVRGELGLLQKVYSGQRAGDVLTFDVKGFFTRL